MNKLIVMLRQVQWRVGRMHEHTCIPYKETQTSVGSIDLEYSNTQEPPDAISDLKLGTAAVSAKTELKAQAHNLTSRR